MLNCKPGDLARIVGNAAEVFGTTQDAFVTVVERAPVGGCQLPDGVWSKCTNPAAWVIEFGSPVVIRMGKTVRQARYAVCPDSHLRPIRDPGADARDETLEWTPVPTRQGEPA